MATANQIYTIVNSLAEQSLGMKDLKPTQADFIAVGKTALSSDENVDAIFKALTDRISKTVVSMRVYRGSRFLRKEGIDYGIALQLIYTDIRDSEMNPSWDVENKDVSPFDYFPSTVYQKIFTDFATWEYNTSIPLVQLKTAFLSAEKMGAFIESLIIAMNNSLELSLENTENLCRNTFMARMLGIGGISTRNLLSEYNKMKNVKLSASEALCLTDKDFLRYCNMEIGLVKDMLKKMSRLYNSEKRATFSDDGSIKFTALSRYAQASRFYLESDSYKYDFVQLPQYMEIPYWQAPGKSASFDDCSKISIQLGNKVIEQSGIIALLCDDMTMGITIENRRITSQYNSLKEFNNLFSKADIGFYNNMAENAVLFYVADDPEPEPEPGEF